MPLKTLSVDKSLRAARAHEKRGEKDQAIALYKSVLERFPRNHRAQQGLQALTQESLDNQPSADLVTGLRTLIKQGELDKARTAASILAEQYPNSSDVANLAGVLEGELGNTAEAVRLLRRAFELKPDASDVMSNLGAALNDLDLSAEALPILLKATKIRPDYVMAHNNLGNAYIKLNRWEDAMRAYERVIELSPNLAEAHQNLGFAFNAIGKRDDAISQFNKAIELKPDFATCHHYLALAKKFTDDDPQIAQVEALVADPSVSKSDRAYYNFTLSKAWEDIGDTEKAFAYLAAANGLRAEFMPYDHDAELKLFASLKSIFSNSGPPQIAPSDDPVKFTTRPVFIVGMPRSGTTLVEQIISSHSQVNGAGELEILNKLLVSVPDIYERSGADAFDAEAIRAVREGYFEGIRQMGVDTPVVTDKMPSNFRWIGFILHAIPEARIVNLMRDPVAVGWSIFKTNLVSRGNAFSSDLTNIGRYYKLYDDLMAFWRTAFPDRIYDVDYEKLTENQESETRKLLSYCELEWEDQCLEFHKTERSVRTASWNQIRRGMYTGSSKAWQAYASKLSPLIDELGELVSAPDQLTING